MTPSVGGILPYGVFRNELKARSTSAACWFWRDVATALVDAHGREQPDLGLLALSRTGALDGCEIVPGLSLSVQSLGAGAATPLHAHAWWHIYVVQAGSGLVLHQGSVEPQRLSINDVIFIPAWSTHGLVNDADAPFVTMNFSNMAEQADLANFKPD